MAIEIISISDRICFKYLYSAKHSGIFTPTIKVGKGAKIRNRYNQVPHLIATTIQPLKPSYTHKMCIILLNDIKCTVY